MKLFNVIILTVLVSCFSCKEEPRQGKEEYPQEFSKKANLKDLEGRPETDSLDALLQWYIRNKKASSITAFVAQHGDVLYNKAFGYKDLENRVPASTTDLYLLFSQTKAVTTVAFMTLVEKGLVAIDDPVSKYFPEIPDQVVTRVNEDGTYETRPVKEPMTFAHLMSHSSGLNAGLVSEIRKAEKNKKDSNEKESSQGSKKDTIPGGQRTFGTDPQSQYLEDEMLALAKYPLGFDPGSEWNYHISTNMLAYMIERISEKSLQEYVHETVLDPLGMDDTDWFYKPKDLDRFVKPYTIEDDSLKAGSTMYALGAVSEKQTYAEGAIGLNGPIEDYAKFCQMLLNEGKFNNHQVLKPETIKTMTTINRLPEKNSGGEGFQFGLGFELQNENKKKIPEVSNSAFSWGGMLGTEYIIDPENNLIALFYINMYERDDMYSPFLESAYALIE